MTIRDILGVVRATGKVVQIDVVSASNGCVLDRKRARWSYLLAATLTIVAGLASRRIEAIPMWVGDLLWATMVFFLLSAVRPALRCRVRAAATLAVSYLVEISQLYQADWINHVRRNPLGHLVLGSGFSWADIAAYTAGTALAVAVDGRLRMARRRT